MYSLLFFFLGQYRSLFMMTCVGRITPFIPNFILLFYLSFCVFGINYLTHKQTTVQKIRHWKHMGMQYDVFKRNSIKQQRIGETTAVIVNYA